MKKQYNQPQLQVTELQTMNVICVSITPGPPAPGNTIGD